MGRASRRWRARNEPTRRRPIPPRITPHDCRRSHGAKGAQPMDNAYNISSSKIIRALAEAEVMSIYFPRVGKALIVDARHDAENGPVIVLDDMVGSAQERLRSVQRLRPGFKDLGQLTLAPWIGSIGAFEEQ